MAAFMGVDIGTSGCKAVAFDEANGSQLARAHCEYELLTPQDGWAELDSEAVMKACLKVIREVALAVGGKVRGIGISSQGEAVTPVAADGRFLANGMVSSDQRALKYVRSFPDAFGQERLYQLTGHTAHPMFTLFKLLWLRDERPDIWRQAAAFHCFEDLLHLRLGLSPAIGWPLAARTMLFDVRRHCWSEEILAEVGLTPGQLARPLASGTPVGTIPASIATQLGLPDDVVVVTGGHDQPCGALGAGVREAGVAMYATGTVECISPAFSEAHFSDELRESNLCTYDHTVDGMYTTVAFSLTGGNALKWFRDTLGAGEMVEAASRKDITAYDLLLAQLPAEPAKLMMLPYLTTSGTPHFDSEVAGALLGMRLTTGRFEILRALLEGVAFEMRINLEIVERAGCPIHELRLIGGGSRSPGWNQLKADVLGVPLSTLDVTEAGCLGVAMLACRAATGATLQELCGAWIRITGRIEPRAEYRAWYNERFACYRELYPALRRLRLFGGVSS